MDVVSARRRWRKRSAWCGTASCRSAIAKTSSKIKTRLLTPDAMTRRVALLDNVKSLKFSWSELEAMVTSTIIGGHRMYCGEGTRPNTLTWFITLNGASLSTDMAQRCVIIKLDKPTRSGSWSDDTRAFIDANRPAIVADVVGFLRSEPMTLTRFSRWSNWERDIVARLPEPSKHRRSSRNGKPAWTWKPRKPRPLRTTSPTSCGGCDMTRTNGCSSRASVANQWYNRRTE